jgi:hypothetical protein
MSSFNDVDSGSSFAGVPGKTYWDEGIEASVLALQYAAKAMGNADFVARANALQQRLTDQWFPVISGPGIKSDALQLDDDIKALTGQSVVYQLDAGIGGVFGVAPPDVEAQVGGDVSANLDALLTDVRSSLPGAPNSLFVPIIKYAEWIGVGLVLLFALYLFWTYRRG